MRSDNTPHMNLKTTERNKKSARSLYGLYLILVTDYTRILFYSHLQNSKDFKVVLQPSLFFSAFYFTGVPAFMWFNNFKKRWEIKGVVVATPRALRLLSFYRRLYSLCSTMHVMLFFTYAAVYAVSVQLTTVPWWIKSGDYKNIQTDQIGFQESLNQSKVKIAEKEALGYLEKEGRSRQAERWWWGEGVCESKPRLFWVIWAWNSTASITEWLRAIPLCDCHSAGERRI